jgi:hypothetical protein
MDIWIQRISWGFERFTVSADIRNNPMLFSTVDVRKTCTLNYRTTGYAVIL